MKQKLLNKLWLRVGMIVAIMTTALTASAAEEVYSTCLFGSAYNSKGVSGYTNVSFTATNGDFSWTVANANNNNNGWSLIKIGGKNGAYTGTITTDAAYSEAITKVVVTIDAITATNVTSIKLYTSPNNSTWTEAGSFTKATGAQTVTLSSPAANLYYKIECVCTKGSSNGLVTVSKVEYYYNAGGNPIVATPTFSPAEGAYTSAQNVTISTTTTGATIYYTTDGNEPTTSSSVYSSAIPVSSTTTIKAMATAAGYDNSSVATATYTIVSLDHAGTEADPYTVADARAAIDANVGKTGVYATGVVSEIVTAYDSGYGNITFDIIDEGGSNTLRAYRCGGDEAASIQVGDIVVVSGDLTLYNSIYEFTQGCQLVSRVHPTVPAILADNVILAYNATSGEITYTIDNPSDATLTAALTTGDWISNVTVDAVNNKVTFTATANEGNADRTATITLSYTGAGDVTVTVTQGHYVVDYATLPFSFDGGRADIANTAGLTETGLGTDYNSSPKLKFDTTGDDLILKINERPGVLTFDVKGNPGGNPSAWIGTFTIQASADGTSYSDVVSYDNLASTKESKTVNNLPADARYIKFVYEKTQGNVALGNIELAEYVYIPPVINAESSVALEFDATSGEIPYTIEYPVDGVSLTATENADWISGINVSADKVTFTATANEGDERSATITLSYTGATDKEVTVTQAAYVPPFASTTWTLATSITSGKHYIIVNNDSEKAMGGQNSNNRAAVDVDIEGETATVTSADVQEFVIYGPDADGLYTIFDGTGYLYAASSGSNQLKTEDEVNVNARWAISFGEGGVASIEASKSSSRNVMQYNSTSALFACYSSASQKPVYLYEKAGEATPTESKTLNASGYATYCSENALDFTGNSDVTAWVITAANSTTGVITFSQIEGKVPAGTGMLLKGSASASVNITSATGTVAAPSSNLLEGTLAPKNVAADEYYGLSGNEFVKVNAGTVPAGKALLPASALSSNVKAFTFVFEDDATGIEETLSNSPLKGENIYNLAGQMVNGKSVNGKLPKGINIVNGKKIMVK